MTSVLTISGPQTIAQRSNALRLILLIAVFSLLWFVLCRHLSSEWTVNEQYNYGWFVPFLALYLFWLRWEKRPRARGAGSPEAEVRHASGSESATARRGESVLRRIGGQRAEARCHRHALIVAVIGIPALFLLLPLRLFEIANPDWRPLGWVHTGAVVALTLICIWYMGGKPWLHHFAFPIAFFFVAVPWVTPMEAPMIQGLMHVVAAVATETVNVFGIPAQLQGNLIRVSTGLVGVTEACSGVRSLQTSLMIGLLFGELKRLSILRRIGLVAGTIGIALCANCARAIFLVWVTDVKGTSATEHWHDLAGYVIVALVFIGSLVLATSLAKTKVEIRKAEVESAEDREQPPARRGLRPGGRTDIRSQKTVVAGVPPAMNLSLQPTRLPLQLPSSYFFIWAICWVLFVEVSAEAWYQSHERNLIATERWDIRWPQSAPGFRDIRIDEAIKRTLRCDEGREIAWTASPVAKSNSTGSIQPLYNFSANGFLFFFRWKPGGSTILRARAHRPDICLPNVGWRQIADSGVRSYPITANFALPFRHFSFVREAALSSHELFADAFFCLSEDRAYKSAGDVTANEVMSGMTTDWSPADRFKAFRRGLRNPGQQVLELVMIAPHQISAMDAETRFAALLPNLVVVHGPLTSDL